MIVVILSLSIPAISYALYRNRNRLSDTVFVTRYGALFLNIKTSTFLCYQYNVLYLARRMIYALSIVFLHEFPGIQLYIQVLMSIG